MKEVKKEAKEILRTIDCYFPKEFNGKDSILWLHKYSNNKKQDEWAGFFFEDFCFSILTKFLGGWKGPRITKSARFDYQRHYVWDFKMHSNTKKWAPLNDLEKTNQIAEENSGIGYIIAKADFKYDKSGELKKWRNLVESRNTKGHILKSYGRITEIKAIFLKKLDIELGIQKKWIKEYKQGKNSGVSAASRKPKYQINVEEIPKQFIITMD
ncbi:MAG: hypothetical protein OEM77_02975 [Nitrosopumilus sp.]|nr:hypothetical protein [Nitrosopumilus sp.]MDH3832585.1 hypothetical protein [Nitrosopumilus sp.]